MSKKHAFNDSLTKICTFLTEDKDKGDYVLICFNKQEAYDIQEMEKAEGNVALVERYETMVETRNEQISLIKAELKHFKNEHFKNKVAELLQFIFIQLDFPESYENHFSKDLRIYLSACRRYRKDLIKLAQDINQEFKTMSPKPELPAA